jgi:hypothetical protein
MRHSALPLKGQCLNVGSTRRPRQARRGWKNGVYGDQTLPPMLYSANATGPVKVIMTMPFSQFVWIVEFATEAQSAVKVTARAVIDHRRHRERFGSDATLALAWPHPGFRL